MDMITVTFKDDNGQWSEELSLIEVAKLSHSAARKILRFECHRVSDQNILITKLQSQLVRLNVVITERDELVDDICEYGRRNPASAPQCIIDLLEQMDSEIE